MKDKLSDFKPYQIYLKNVRQITEFEQLTYLSYSLSENVLFNQLKDEIPQFENGSIEEFKKGSFCLADVISKKVLNKSEWITIEDYKARTNKTTNQIEKLIAQNKLGNVVNDPKSGERLVIWPQTFKNKTLEELPKPGRSRLSVALEIKFSVNDKDNLKNYEKIKNEFLTLAHSIGKPNDVSKNSKSILYRSCFLLHWSSFEVFIRSTCDQILINNPTILFDDKQAEKLTISYKDLFNYSNKLESISSLQSKIIENEIAKHESDGKSIHGIINFLNTKLKFEKEPYKAWYQFNGKDKETSYKSLIELKDVRNVLMHDSGIPSKDFFIKYPNVPKKSGSIVMNHDYYLNAILSLRSIAHHLNDIITKKKYKVI